MAQVEIGLDTSIQIPISGEKDQVSQTVEPVSSTESSGSKTLTESLNSPSVDSSTTPTSSIPRSTTFPQPPPIPPHRHQEPPEFQQHHNTPLPPVPKTRPIHSESQPTNPQASTPTPSTQESQTSNDLSASSSTTDRNPPPLPLHHHGNHGQHKAEHHHSPLPAPPPVQNRSESPKVPPHRSSPRPTNTITETTKPRNPTSRVKAICLGCAGMVGLDAAVREACIEELGEDEGVKVRIVDGVKAGVGLLVGMARTGM